MALASKASVASRSSVRATFRPVTASRRFSQVVRAQETAVTSKVLDVTDKTFSAEVLKSAEPVLVDFWAPWCGPCRMIAPLVDEIAAEYSGKVKCVKINTDESPDVATDYGVRSIPTVMIFKGGKKLDTIIGAVPKNTLVQTVNKYL